MRRPTTRPAPLRAGLAYSAEEAGTLLEALNSLDPWGTGRSARYCRVLGKLRRELERVLARLTRAEGNTHRQRGRGDRT